MACVRFYVSLVALLVPCVMSGFMEMFGPQGSVGFLYVIFVMSRTFVHRFVLSLVDLELKGGVNSAILELQP